MNIEERSLSNSSFQKAHPVMYKILIGIALFIVSFSVYRQVINHEFITFDDGIYVTDNSPVIKGISLRGVLWAFSLTEKKDSPYWHPLTWLSHMLDCQLFGLNAGKHHLTNLIFHTANSILLFFLLNLATGSVWRSAAVASLFAVHPVNVESVAWLAERKNVLSAFFWMLTIIFYIYYTKRQNIFRYLASLLSFFLGLLAKPMLVTLPFVLILFDYWPLERFDLKQSGLRKKIFNLVLEKVPFFIISFCSIYITTVSLKLTSNTISTGYVPIKLRLENAVVSYTAYMGKMIWPSELSVYYPFPASIAVWKIIASLILLVSVTVFVLFKMRNYLFLGTGWFWFIGTLVPVSGIIQGGLWPAMADRWAYIPYIGLFVIISWSGYELINKYCLKNILTITISLTILFALSAKTYVQLQSWHDSKSVYKNALETGSVNPVMLNNMGNAFLKEGRLQEAIGYYKKALELKPDYQKAYCNIGIAMYQQGYIKEAVEYYGKSLKLSPNDEKTHNNIGAAMLKLGKKKEAIFHFEEALRIKPDFDEAFYNLGLLYFSLDKIEEAAGHYARAISINPYNAEAHNSLGLSNYKLGKTGLAVKNYNDALKLNPNMAQAHENLGVILFYAGDYDNALSHLEKALEINPKDNGVREKIKLAQEEKEKFQIEEKILLEKIAVAPNDFEHHGKLGDLYAKYKRLDLAAAQYTKAIMINPDNHIDIIKLAKIHAMKGNFSKALTEAEKAIRLKPDYAYGYYFIASVYSLLNDRERAVEWLKKAVDNGFDQLAYMRSDKNLNNIRNTSYYNALSVNK